MRHFGKFLRSRSSPRTCWSTSLFGGLCMKTEKRSVKTELPLDKIDLKSLHMYGFHGALKDEKLQGQRFIVDTTVFLPLRNAGVSDSLAHTVNYVSILRDLERIMHGPTIDLIEHLAELMCYSILRNYPIINRVQVSIKKPDAPLPIPTDSFKYVGVTILRMREHYDFSRSSIKEESEGDD